jgi:uncharacterized protein YggE
MEQPSQNNAKPTGVHIDYRLIVGILLVVIAGMLVVWKPWHGSTSAKDRTIQVTGDATLTAEPDEFVFNPSYQFKNSDKQAAVADLTAKSNDVVAKLKGLGVANSKIKTNADSWAYPVYDSSNATPTYTLTLTVTVSDKMLAQKVEDYLVGTAPSGTLTPQATFSTATRKSLEAQGRNKASQEARAKAEQSAKNLGFKLGAVKAVDDGSGFGGIYPLRGGAPGTMDIKSNEESLTIQPGENTLNYSVTVTYYIK